MPKSPRVESQWKAERERLASELHRLEEALSDARDGTGGTGGEEEGSLVARLREATRKRVRIEEEFERSSDRWRDERRNLNAEIDRLDRALQKTQSEARRSRSTETVNDTKLQTELREAVRHRDEVEGTLDAERNQWESERYSLEARIADLESGLVDALERANNAAQSDQSRDDAHRVEIEAQRRKIETEIRSQFDSRAEELQKTVEDLEKERGQLHLEIHRLNSEPATRTEQETPAAPPETGRLSLKDRLRGRLLGGEEREVPAPTAASEELAGMQAELEREKARADEATRRSEAAEARLSELPEAPAVAPDSERVQKLEAELQSQAEAWEAERGALGAQILKLETSLGQAETAAVPGTEGDQEREALLAKISDLEGALASAREAQAGADSAIRELENRIETAQAERDAGREDLQARVQSLETSLGEARSAGETSTEAAQEISSQLAAAEERARNMEQSRAEEASGWSGKRDELLRQVADLESAVGQAEAARTDLDHQLEQIQAEFEETRREAKELRDQANEGSREWEEERASLRGQIDELQTTLRDDRQADASSDARVQKLVSDLEAAEARLSAASGEWQAEKRQLGETLAALERRLENSEGASTVEQERLAEELAGEREAREVLEAQLAEVRSQLESSGAEWAGERQQLGTAAAEASRLSTALEAESSRVRELEATLSGSSDDTQQLESSVAEATSQRKAVEAELQARTQSWDAERAQLEDTIGEMNRELAELRKAHSKGKAASTGESAASRGIASFGKVLSSLGGGTRERDGSRSVADLEARRQALEVRLQGSEDARDELATQLQAASEEWEQERVKLEAQLVEMNAAATPASEQEKTDLEAQHRDLLSRLRDAEERYTKLEEVSMSSARAWDDQRGVLEKEIAQWEQQVAAEAERVAEETRKALAEEYDKQLKELRKEKEDLQAQLKAPGAAGGMDLGGAVDPETLASEIARVDGEIDEINRLIDDPNAALSNVMRKNAERSELKAYRRGLAYLAERVSKDGQETPEADREPAT